MPKLTINLDDKEMRILKKRAKKNLLSVREQIEDIVRRSCVTYKSGGQYKDVKPDDKLISVFSRSRRGRKKKVKKKKKK